MAAYSIRRKSTLFEPIFQIRLKPAVKNLELVGQTARCLLASKASATLVDFDLKTGSEIRRVEDLPLMGDTWFAPDGRGIGILRTAAVGQGPTLLRFLSADGHLGTESSVPDATSEIALGPDLWYVGCRNGCLYAFGFDGKQRWVWEIPGSKAFDNNKYFRPCRGASRVLARLFGEASSNLSVRELLEPRCRWHRKALAGLPVKGCWKRRTGFARPGR
jgi:hypothetical protein